MATSSIVNHSNLASLPAAVPGFGDYDIKQQIMFDLWKKALRQNYELHGFTPLELPPFVRREFLQAKGGINNEIFALHSLWTGDPTHYGLAFDRTVPFALYVRDHQKELPFPFKRYDISYSYRAEDPAPGRFQGFYQCDLDIAGKNLSLDNDVQCISGLIEGLNRLLEGVEDPAKRSFKMYLNHISIPKQLLGSFNMSEDQLAASLKVVDKLEKIGVVKVSEELKNILGATADGKAIDGILKILTFKGPIDEFSVPDNFPEEALKGLNDLKQIIKNLSSNGISMECLQFCPGMVRGLNYYTGVVFETFLDALSKATSVMSGGRYDGLVDAFTKNSQGELKKTGINGVGGSIGLTRLFDVLSNEKLINPMVKTACKVIVLYREKSPQIWNIASAIRKEGISCDVFTGETKNITKQLNHANKAGFPVAVMVMEEKAICVKHLTNSDKDKEVKDLPSVESVVAAIKKFLGE